LVAQAAGEGKTLTEMPLPVLRKAAKQIGKDVRDYLGAANVVKHYVPDGAGGIKQLRKQLAFWKRKLR
jgi:argininosuccinate lyase